MNELIAIEKKDIAKVFQEGGTDFLVKIIADEVTGHIFDVSTLKGRKEIASLAAKVSRSKTYLDGVGKFYVAELKEKPKSVDAERKRMRDYLDDLKEEVRRPLSEWEVVEGARIVSHENNIEEIKNSGNIAVEMWQSSPIAAMENRLSEIVSQIFDKTTWEEYLNDALSAKEAAVLQITGAIEKRNAYEKEQAELIELRRLKAETEQKERDEAMRREGEERVKHESEEKERAAIQAKSDAEQRERDAVQASELAKKNAERRAEEAEKQAGRQAEAAAKAERDRIENERASEERAAKAREANLQHRGKINRAAAAKLIELGLSETKAKEIVTAIAKGNIPFIEIHY